MWYRRWIETAWPGRDGSFQLVNTGGKLIYQVKIAVERRCVDKIEYLIPCLDLVLAAVSVERLSHQEKV
jgi:hypothetical protein